MNINGINNANMAARVDGPKAPPRQKKASEPADKFTPWKKNPEIHGVKDYLKNIPASVGNGVVGFGIVGGGKTIVALGMDGKPSSKLGRIAKSAVIVTAMTSCALVGAGVGLAMGVVGKNAGSLINAKHFQK